MELKPGYKQTEVGVIPQDWSSPSLKDIAASRSNAIVGGPFGSDLVSGDYVSTGIPVVRGQNMSKHYVSGDFVFVSSLKAKQLQANCARPGDIVFTQRGTLGQVSIVPNRPYSQYVVSQSQMKLTLNPVFASAEYIYQFFVSAEGRQQILDSAIQTGVPHTNLGILRSYRVPFPPTISEQQAIAEALSNADVLIKSLERLLTKKRQIKQGAMQDLLTGQRRLPGFSGEWEVVRLGDLSSLYKGKGLPKSSLNPLGSEKCIHYGELFTKYPEIVCKIISRTDTTKEVFRSAANDVLMPTSDVTPRGLAKASCILVNDVILGGDILVIRPDEHRLHGAFLSHLIRQEENQVLQLVTGTTVFHLYGSDMKRFTFPLPSVEEQTAIVSILSVVASEITTLETKLQKVRQLKQGMMQELLTGRIRLV